jgi:hypothetical protein
MASSRQVVGSDLQEVRYDLEVLVRDPKIPRASIQSRPHEVGVHVPHMYSTCTLHADWQRGVHSAADSGADSPGSALLGACCMCGGMDGGEGADG